jgi:hypothetical protein
MSHPRKFWRSKENRGNGIGKQIEIYDQSKGNFEKFEIYAEREWEKRKIN